MIAVVIPAFDCADTILTVIEGIGDDVDRIIVVDDDCPGKSGEIVQTQCDDARVTVLFHASNQGVGGATMTGFQKAIELGAEIIVKIDSDGQMDASYIPKLVRPILEGRADFTKGNRFFNLEDLESMPTHRLVGNAGLSFLSKLSTGYWRVMDPTNGFFAIHANLIRVLPLAKIARGYFFESDLLFRLGTFRAKVVEIAMSARYQGEVSHLSVRKAFFEFGYLHLVRIVKRFFYNYLLRNFNIASLLTLFGIVFLMFGVIFGAVEWYASIKSGVLTSTGTVMIAVLPIVLGFQMLLSALQYDIANEPTEVIHVHLN